MRALRFDNGDLMPAIGLGTWKSAPGEIGAAIHAAIGLGYRHFDCASIYGNEAEIGAAFGESFAAGEVRREELWITSKLWNTAHAPADVAPALRATLGDLGLDYLDLYLIHWPVATRPGQLFPQGAEDMISPQELPLATTWAAMEAVKRDGLARHIGVSNLSATKLRGLIAEATTRPEVDQIELHPYLQQSAILDLCRAEGIILTAYSPLGSRDRPARLRKDGEPVLLQDPILQEIAARHRASVAQVLIAWAIERGTSVIPKSVNPTRLAENLAADKLQLSPQDMAQIQGLDRGRRYVDGSIWAIEGGPYTLANLWDE